MSTSLDNLYGLQFNYNQGWWLPQYEQLKKLARTPVPAAEAAQQAKGLAQTQALIDKGICLGLCAMWVTRRMKKPSETPNGRYAFLTLPGTIQNAVERQLLHASADLRANETIKLAFAVNRAETKGGTYPNIPESSRREDSRKYSGRKNAAVERDRNEATYASLMSPNKGPINGGAGIDEETQAAFSLLDDNLELVECKAGENGVLLQGDEKERFQTNAFALISDNLNYYLIAVHGRENGHAMICYRAEGKTIFFDPNHGEYAVDADKLVGFFGYIYDRYKTEHGEIAKYEIILIRLRPTRARS